MWLLLSSSAILLYFCLYTMQASIANDPWSSWNVGKSGNWDNGNAVDSWATKPESAPGQRNSASNNWEAATAAFGHPQAYQGPGVLIMLFFFFNKLEQVDSRGKNYLIFHNYRPWLI